MLKSRTILLIILFTLIYPLVGKSQTDSASHNILVLFAMQPNTPAYHSILYGISEKLSERFGDSYNLFTEYLEKGLYPEGEYPREKFNLINEKYNNSNLDLLICVGVNIIEIVHKNAADYLLQLPVVSLDLDFSAYGFETPFALNKHTAEIRLKLNVEKTITEALSLFPKTESVYFVSGVAQFDKLLLSISKQVAERIIKNKKIIYVTDLSMDETTSIVRNLPKRSIIFVSNYNVDSKGVPYFNPEAVRIISRNANAPVFVYTSTGFGDGAIGGYILNFEKAGLIAGEAAVKILNGSDPVSIDANEKDYYEFIYDWRALKRWKIADTDLVPEGSTILFEEFNLIDKYKWIGGVVLLFLVLQTALIFNLIRLNKNQKLMTKKIIDTENRYREFLYNDRSLRLGQLTASLSHELNQPLTAILSTAQAGINFINSNEATPELLKQILQKIVENDKRGASILSSIRGMMRLESKEKEKTNLDSLIDEVVSVYKSEAGKFSIQIQVMYPDMPVYIQVDKIQIQQVILNLIINASQSLEKSDTKNKNIHITQTLSNGNVIVSVRDYGDGIAETIINKLFKPFATLKKEGMGIGLSICRSIIEDHGGKIWAENIPGGGAKFSFSLKILKDE